MIKKERKEKRIGVQQMDNIKKSNKKTSDNKVYDYTALAVILVLILIIFTLILIMYSGGIFILPIWLIQTVVGGLFTLIGAGTGAFLAGFFTLKSVNKQINFTKEQKREEESISFYRNTNVISSLIVELQEEGRGFLEYARKNNGNIDYYIPEWVTLESMSIRLDGLLYDNQFISNFFPEDYEVLMSIRSEHTLFRRVLKSITSSFHSDTIGVAYETFEIYCKMLEIGLDELEELNKNLVN